MERGQKLFGVVVTPTSPPDHHHTNKVFVLQDSGLHKLFFVLKEAFTLAPEAIEQFDGNEFDIVADIKNQVRRREKPLNVGDWISWFYSGQDEIAEFRREHKLHEMRVGHPYYQFKLECVKSPTDISLYNHTFGYVAISAMEARRLLANVAFTAWVDIYIDESSGKEKLGVKFHSYHTTDHQMQIKVLDAPWTEHHKVDQRGLTEEDELEWLIVKVGEDKAKQNNVYGKFGYYLAQGSMYHEETPEKFYILPYVDETELVPGVQYRFDAFWNETMNQFIVTGYEKMVDMDVLQTKGEAREMIMVLDGVQQRNDVKCLFISNKLNFGLMDDPTGVMAIHHLSRYAESKCRVYFYEDRHASFGRFRIERIEEDKAEKIEKNVREGVSVVKGIKGVVISSEGRVFSAAHSPLRIFLPAGTSYPIGTQIVFNARLDHDTKELEAIYDSNMKVLPISSGPIDYFEYNGRLIFKTDASWTARSDPIFGIVSEQFSLLDDPLKLLPRSCGKAVATVKVWVAESGMDREGVRRVAQTPFFIVAHKTSKPTFTAPSFIDEHGRDLSGWIRLRDGSLQGMEADVPAEAPTVAGKFTRPSRGPSSVPPAPLSSASSMSSLPSFSSSAPHTPFDCGCKKKKCVARRMIIDMMNDEAFRRVAPNEMLDDLLGCIIN